MSQQARSWAWVVSVCKNCGSTYTGGRVDRDADEGVAVDSSGASGTAVPGVKKREFSFSCRIIGLDAGADDFGMPRARLHAREVVF